jgi:hypothetical protein
MAGVLVAGIEWRARGYAAAIAAPAAAARASAHVHMEGT